MSVHNEHGQIDPPIGAFTSVSAGSWHSCALRTHGTIACWGANGQGQVSPPDETISSAGTYTQVAGGGSHTCALRINRTIVCWGNNAHGQIDVTE